VTWWSYWVGGAPIAEISRSRAARSVGNFSDLGIEQNWTVSSTAVSNSHHSVCQWCNSCMQWVGEQWPKSLYVRVFYVNKTSQDPFQLMFHHIHITVAVSQLLLYDTANTSPSTSTARNKKMDNCMSLKFREFRGRRGRPKSYLDRALKFREVRVCHAWTVEVLGLLKQLWNSEKLEGAMDDRCLT